MKDLVAIMSVDNWLIQKTLQNILQRSLTFVWR